MAYKVKLSLLLLLSLSAFSQLPNVHAAQEITNQRKPLDNINIHKISILLSDKGYNAMSLTLEMVLQSLIPPELETDNTTAITIFCPVDKAFLSSKYSQPPLTLLQYHVAPSNINVKALKSTLPHGSKIDTLLLGHPLVVTTLPGNGHASINDVKILEWDLYNDGKVIIHGIEEFFDPAFQTLRYPWFDGGKSGNDTGSVVKAFSDGSFRLFALEASALLILLLFVSFNIGHRYSRTRLCICGAIIFIGLFCC